VQVPGFWMEDKILSKVKAPSHGVGETFEPGEWLNDASITFGYGCCEASGALPKTVMLLDPATAFWLAMQQDQEHLEEARQALKLQELDAILCPINDSRDAEQADAGTHWTLLVGWSASCSSSSQRKLATAAQKHPSWQFSYYDSLSLAFPGDANLQQAEALASRLADRPVRISADPCPQQNNLSDCGVYVLLFSEIIVGEVNAVRCGGGRSCEYNGDLKRAPVWEERLVSVTPDDVTTCRARYHRLASLASQERAAADKLPERCGLQSRRPASNSTTFSQDRIFAMR